MCQDQNVKAMAEAAKIREEGLKKIREVCNSDASDMTKVELVRALLTECEIMCEMIK